MHLLGVQFERQPAQPEAGQNAAHISVHPDLGDGGHRHHIDRSRAKTGLKGAHGGLPQKRAKVDLGIEPAFEIAAFVLAVDEMRIGRRQQRRLRADGEHDLDLRRAAIGEDFGGTRGAVDAARPEFARGHEIVAKGLFGANHPIIARQIGREKIIGGLGNVIDAAVAVGGQIEAKVVVTAQVFGQDQPYPRPRQPRAVEPQDMLQRRGRRFGRAGMHDQGGHSDVLVLAKRNAR